MHASALTAWCSSTAPWPHKLWQPDNSISGDPAFSGTLNPCYSGILPCISECSSSVDYSRLLSAPGSSPQSPALEPPTLDKIRRKSPKPNSRFLPTCCGRQRLLSPLRPLYCFPFLLGISDWHRDAGCQRHSRRLKTPQGPRQRRARAGTILDC